MRWTFSWLWACGIPDKVLASGMGSELYPQTLTAVLTVLHRESSDILEAGSIESKRNIDWPSSENLRSHDESQTQKLTV